MANGICSNIIFACHLFMIVTIIVYISTILHYDIPTANWLVSNLISKVYFIFPLYMFNVTKL